MRSLRYPRKEHITLAVVFCIVVALPIVVLGWPQAIFLVGVGVAGVLVMGKYNLEKDRREKWLKEREELLKPAGKKEKLSFDLGKK